MNQLFNLRFLKFGLVGISGMALDFGITFLCKEKWKLNKYLANSLGFVVAAASNYYLNRIWTFSQSTTPELGQFAKFLTVSLIGLGINNLFLYYFVKRTTYNFYLLKILVIGIVFLWNYFANIFITFQ